MPGSGSVSNRIAHANTNLYAPESLRPTLLLSQTLGCARLSLGDLDVLFGAAYFTFSDTKPLRLVAIPTTPNPMPNSRAAMGSGVQCVRS